MPPTPIHWKVPHQPVLGTATEPVTLTPSISACQRLGENSLLALASRRDVPVWATLIVYSSHSPGWKLLTTAPVALPMGAMMSTSVLVREKPPWVPPGRAWHETPSPPL